MKDGWYVTKKNKHEYLNNDKLDVHGEVHNATEPLTLRVTEKHGKKGVPRDRGNCALSVCGKETKNIIHMVTGASRAYAMHKGTNYFAKYIVTADNGFQTKMFDTYGKIQTGNYILKVPQPSKRHGNGESRKDRGPKTRNVPQIRRKVRTFRATLRVTKS